MWQLFAKATGTDAIGYNGKASNSVSLLRFYYKPYILFHTYDDTYLDANTHPAFQVPAVCVILTLVGVSGSWGNKIVAMAPWKYLYQKYCICLQIVSMY